MRETASPDIVTERLAGGEDPVSAVRREQVRDPLEEGSILVSEGRRPVRVDVDSPTTRPSWAIGTTISERVEGTQAR